MSNQDPLSECIEAYERLISALSRLSTFIRKDRASVRYLAKLPIPMAGAASGGLLASMSEMDVDRYKIISESDHPSEGINDALDALTRLQFVEGQDKKSTIRMPGVLVVPDAAIEAALEVNAAKDALKTLMSEKASYQDKNAIKREYKCSLLQAYRAIILIDDPVEVITFSWARGNNSIERIKVKDLRERIDKYYVGEPDDDATSKIEGGIVNSTGMLNAISSLREDEIVALKREVKPHIKVNFKLENGGWRSADGATPILVSESASKALRLIEPLSRETTQRRKRASIFEKEPVIDKLNCYRYLEPEYAE